MEALLTPNAGFIFWHSVIMLVTFFVLGRFAWKPLLTFIKAREQAHQKAIEERQQIAKEVAAVEATKEKILQQAKEEEGAILQKALEDKEALLKEAEKEALEEKKKIIADALKIIAREREMAQSALKKQTVALIIHATEKLLTKELSQSSTQQKLIKQMIHDVESGS